MLYVLTFKERCCQNRAPPDFVISTTKVVQKCSTKPFLSARPRSPTFAAPFSFQRIDDDEDRFCAAARRETAGRHPRGVQPAAMPLASKQVPRFRDPSAAV